MKTILLTLFLSLSIAAIGQEDTYPVLKLGSIANGDTASYSQVKSAKFFYFENEDGSRSSAHKIINGQLIVNHIPGAGEIEKGGFLNKETQYLLYKSRGKKVAAEVRYQAADGSAQIATFKFYVATK